MVSKNSKLFDIFFRYFLLLIFSFKSLFVFYLVLTPATIYAVYFLNKIFFSVFLSGNILQINNILISLSSPCIAVSAYYLLLILNLSTPKIKQRTFAILFSFAILFIFNILRIFFLGILLQNNFFAFEFFHKFTWYFISVFFVIFIWFLEVKIFDIKEIPFYSDIKFLKHLKND